MLQNRTKTRKALISLFVASGLGALTSAPSSFAEAGKEQLKVVNYMRANSHKSLDPQAQFDQASHELVSNMFDSLLDYSYLERPYKLAPGLLATMPEKQKDGVSYRLTLRKGVFFHDDAAFPGGKGRELKADDVIYTLKRFADANVNNLSYSLAEGFYAGLDEFREATRKAGKNANYDKLPAVEGLKKIDDYTIMLKLTRDNPLALFPLATSQTSIVAREVVEKYGADFQNHPVGTGAFYPVKLERRGDIVLKKNPKYFGTYPSVGAPGDKEAGLLADAGKQLPLIDEVRIQLIEEAQPAMLKFRRGELDWVEMNKDDFSSLAVRNKDGSFALKPEVANKFRLYAEPMLSTEFIELNTKDPILGKNLKLRQAIAYAIDVEAMINLLRNGRGIALHTIVPLPIWGSQKDMPFDYYKKDLAKAKQLLAEAGYPEGKGLPELNIDYRAATKSARQEYEYLRNELAQVGIKLKGNFLQFSAFTKKVEEGNFQMTANGWGADFPDPENFYFLLYSKNKAPGPNHIAYNNPEYDKLYEQMRFMTNGPERLAIMKRLAEIIRDDVPVILRFNGIAVGLTQPWLSNFKRNEVDRMPLKFFNLDLSKKPAS